LPALTESFLSKDFDFAEYLARAHGKALDEHLKTHFMTMLSCLPIVILFFLFIATEPTMIYLDTFEIEISSTFIMNTVLLIFFTAVLSVFWFVRRDLE
jgi:hypothetical protein